MQEIKLDLKRAELNTKRLCRSDSQSRAFDSYIAEISDIMIGHLLTLTGLIH